MHTLHHTGTPMHMIGSQLSGFDVNLYKKISGSCEMFYGLGFNMTP